MAKATVRTAEQIERDVRKLRDWNPSQADVRAAAKARGKRECAIARFRMSDAQEVFALERLADYEPSKLRSLLQHYGNMRNLLAVEVKAFRFRHERGDYGDAPVGDAWDAFAKDLSLDSYFPDEQRTYRLGNGTNATTAVAGR